MRSSNMLAQALLYAGAGINVFPVSSSKLPLTGKGGFHHATTDRQQIEQWWHKWPSAGIATADFDVVDVDTYKEGGAADWAQIRTLIPSKTPQQKTPRGGMQFFFAAGSLNGRKFASTIDLRYAGSNYVLLPPSRFEDYGYYEWVTSILERKPKPAPEFPDSSPRNGPAPAIAEKIPYGSQHYELVSLAGSMRRRGMNADEIFAALWQVNLNRCEFPGPEANVRQIAESVAQYEPSVSATSQVTPLRVVDPDPTSFTGRSHAEVLALEFPPERMLVDDLVPIGAVGTIAGVPETHKSWLAQRMAVMVATGQGLMFGKGVAHSGPVGYFWQDDSTREEAERVKLYDSVHGSGEDMPIRWFLNEGLELPAHIDRLRMTIVERSLVLVILDSFYNILFGKDLKSDEAERAIAELKTEVCDATDCTVVIVDHMPWATETNRGRLRSYGGVFKGAATRFGIYIDAVGSKLWVEARGNNIQGFKRSLAKWNVDALDMELVDTSEHVDDSEYERRIAEYLLEHPDAETSEMSGKGKAIKGDNNELVAARGRLLERGELIRTRKHTNRGPYLWRLSVHAGLGGMNSDSYQQNMDEEYGDTVVCPEGALPAPYDSDTREKDDGIPF